MSEPLCWQALCSCLAAGCAIRFVRRAEACRGRRMIAKTPNYRRFAKYFALLHITGLRIQLDADHDGV